MAERRMLSKTISTSRKVNRLPDRASLLYTWLIPHTDDYGRMEGDSMSIRAKVVPMRPVTIDEVENDLILLESSGLIRRYAVNGETYLEITNFDSFQTFRGDRPRRSEYPDDQGNMTNDNQRDTSDIPEGDNDPRKVSKDKGREVKVSKDIYGEFEKVELTEVEYGKLINQLGEKNTKILIAELDTGIASKGYKYKSHYATILNWARRKIENHNEKKLSGGKYQIKQL